MDLKEITSESPSRHRSPTRLRLRNYFLTGIVVAAPISITIYLTWSFVHWVDGWIKPLIPDAYSPDHYLPFSVPGFGLLVAILALTLLGFMTANLVGRTIVSYGEVLLDRMPLVRNLYRTLKQIFEAVLSESTRTFKQVGIIEYPRTGLWSLVFVATDTKGEVKARLADSGEEVVSVFLPTTPNPTSGYLLFVPRQDLMLLDMSVEDGAKLIISAGLVSPDYCKPMKNLAGERKEREAAPPAVAAE